MDVSSYSIKLNFEVFDRFSIDTCTPDGEMFCGACGAEFETRNNRLSEFLKLAIEHLKTCEESEAT